MRYLILGTLALACAAAASPAARAMDLSVCNQPIATLNVRQLEDCQIAEIASRKQAENFFNMQYKARHEAYLREHACGAVVVGHWGQEPVTLERCK
jgi:hypothetical protein